MKVGVKSNFGRGGGEGVRLHLGCTSVRQNNQPRVKYAKLREWVIIANRLYSGLRKNKNESIFP